MKNLLNILDIKNKVALVTGASRGIGNAIAKILASLGAVVIGTATTKAGADKLTEELSAINPKSFGVQLNITDFQQASDVVKNINQRLEQFPDILVNNAGITNDNLFLRMSPEEWQKVIDVNLTGAYNLSKVCMRSMLKKRFGRIINIGSVVGVMGNAGQANYAAAKAGLIGFSKSLARELGNRNITVNVVAPGFIETDMTKEMTSEQQGKLLEQISLNKMGSVDDVANAVLFLASPMASYITGETLHVNGGMYMI